MITQFFLDMSIDTYSEHLHIPAYSFYDCDILPTSWPKMQQLEAERVHGIVLVERLPSAPYVTISFNTLENMTKFQMNYL